MTIRVQAAAFDPWEELTSYERSARERLAGKTGGAAVFVGSMRDFNQGQTVRAMTLEHYPGMTVNYLEKVEAEARTRWPLLDCLVIHRYGPLQPGDPIVLVAAWAAHRDAAFSACRYLIDELKTRAPFWKQEQTAAGRRWVAPEGSEK
ncbi:MAG: molybdopterin converting factor [Candidatus Muproteobacteria bacterium RBG_16_64_11]|uniref:Molybdopterin synthase catalytic subunit n=1 Tax=Candidatus Muproteobacteria bacterium RBG_16_64_11 TaxID=1817758 RepID=A0A1F6THG4_9PROT|nr:MAG: molybdopterin converting factor [Candidatus Muproteobacteria bacterium RBG_16_64_11]